MWDKDFYGAIKVLADADTESTVASPVAQSGNAFAMAKSNVAWKLSQEQKRKWYDERETVEMRNVFTETLTDRAIQPASFVRLILASEQAKRAQMLARFVWHADEEQTL